jgi:hypothetical protein
VLWQTQRRAMRALRDEVLAGGAGAAARDVTARIAARPPKGARRGAKKAR